jgi:hypothetical protein
MGRALCSFLLTLIVATVAETINGVGHSIARLWTRTAMAG